MSKITVYYFEEYDINTDKLIGRSKHMATLEWIKKHVQLYKIITDTAKEIDESELENGGIYRE
jgi:hypothetical protein